MADFKKYFDKLLKWEGGWSDDPNDKGGKTNMGVTLETWRKMGWDNDQDGDKDEYDLRNATKEQIGIISKKNYWDLVKGDDIKDQLIAQHITDFAYNSGPVTSIKRLQRVLGLKDDGVFGNITLNAVNNSNPQILLDKLVSDRLGFLNAIIARDPSQKKFEKGWKRRTLDVVNKPYK